LDADKILDALIADKEASGVKAKTTAPNASASKSPVQTQDAAGLNLHKSAPTEAIKSFESGDYTNVYFVQCSREELSEIGHLENIGWRAQGKDVWVDSRTGAMLIRSEASVEKVIASFCDIIDAGEKIKGSKKSQKRIKEITGIDLKGISRALIIDHQTADNYGSYDKNGTLVISANVLGTDKEEIVAKLVEIEGIRKAQIRALIETIYMYMDVKDIEELQNYIAILNAVGGKNLIVDFEVFKGLSEEKIINIASLAKNNGIRIFVREENPSNVSERRTKMRELGFQGYIVGREGKMYKYDNMGLEAEEISLIEKYKNGEELNEILESAGNPNKALRLSELMRILEGETRSVTGKIAVLETFKSAIVKINAGKMGNREYVRSVGYNLAYSAQLSEENIKDFCAAQKAGNISEAQKALKVTQESGAYLYIKQLEGSLKGNPDADLIKMEFLKGLLIKYLSSRELEKAAIDKGLADEGMEKKLGEKLLQRYLEGIKESEISQEITEFINSDPTLPQIREKIAEKSEQNTPEAINGTIKLILLSEQKVGKIAIEKHPQFTVSAIKQILAAA
jgi:hypothetical protein